ncbi:MAG: cyclic nucleotide-binding domain-containing protein [Pirellulales bacterium]|nr:cyclic nucleotide-binding domain-containing protein [Pirellulales bacterium]
MSESDQRIQRIKPDDVPLSSDFAEADLDQLINRSIFDSLDSKFRTSQAFRKILRMHARVVSCEDGDIIIREGDWGNSAFFVLTGEVAVELEPPGEFLSNAALGRSTAQRKTWFQSLAQLWRNPRGAEYRKFTKKAWDDKWTAARDDGRRIYFQDVPRLLEDFKTDRMQEGELFGELAALGRTARTATVFAVGKAELLEIRWQGLRDLIKKDAGVRQQIDERFRSNAFRSFLRGVLFLQHLSKDDQALDVLVREARLETYGEYDQVGSLKQLAEKEASLNLAHEPIVAEEGHYPNGVILIRSGVARVSRRHHQGHQTLSYLTPGKMFGFEEVRAGWKSGKSVPFRHSLRAIGYLTTVVIPTPLVEEHLRRTEGPPSADRGHGSPSQQSASLPVDDKGLIDPDFMEFLVQERFINGTATMLINLDRCTRCDDCVRACASTHDNNPRFLRQGPIHDNIMVARSCMHCQDPVCMIECPTGAISRELDGGEVAINDNTCIGCGACSRNCPYEAIRLVEIRDGAGQFIRAVKDRKPITKATKCDLCVDQLGGPACQRACPHDALARLDMGEVASLAAWLDQ